jgi:hypothetical protein
MKIDHSPLQCTVFIDNGLRNGKGTGGLLEPDTAELTQFLVVLYPLTKI